MFNVVCACALAVKAADAANASATAERAKGLMIPPPLDGFARRNAAYTFDFVRSTG
jgi:hypothetical protein